MNSHKALKQKSTPLEHSISPLPFTPGQLDDFFFVAPTGDHYRLASDMPVVLPSPVKPGEPGAEDWDEIVRSYRSRLNAANGPVLVVDAGNGGLMDALRRHGLAVMGCEPSARLAQVARRKHGFDEHTFYCSDTESFLGWLNRIGRKVQAVFLWHTLEHVSNPETLLRQIASVLDQDGLVIAQLALAAEGVGATGQGMLDQNIIINAAAKCGLELKNVDCDFGNFFTAFVFRKASAGQLDPACVMPPAWAAAAGGI